MSQKSSSGKKRGRPPIPRARARILDAAAKVISRSGQVGIELSEVVEEAAVSRPTTYRVFPGGREEVIQSTVARAVDAFSRRMLASLEGIDDPLDLVVEAVLYQLTEIPKDPVLRPALKEGAVQALLGAGSQETGLISPGEIIISLYREMIPQASAEQVGSLLELGRRIGLSSLILGEQDGLRRGDEAARSKLKTWLGPLIREHQTGETCG